jgi:hypothetical protein
MIQIAAIPGKYETEDHESKATSFYNLYIVRDIDKNVPQRCLQI